MKYFIYILLLTFSVSCFGQFPLIEKGKPALVYIPDNQSNVINSAYEMFSEDMEMVSGQKPVNGNILQNNFIIVVNLKAFSDNTIKEILKTADLSEIQNQWEAFHIQQIRYKNKNFLLVAGSDARGTAYGILELSRLIGVSPWVWWADCIPEKKAEFYLPENYTDTQKPSVQYRSLFINDEDWGFMPWATKTFDPTAQKGEITSKVYEKVFQLLLRLRANTLLPAMHECTVPFHKVAGNAQMADKYGIIIATSHCEPMLCNIAGEWDKKVFGDYNYLTNKDFILNYWKNRIIDTKKYENIYTLGMRGVHDGQMEGVKTLEEQTTALQQVIDAQRELLKENVNPEPEQLPQQFVPYKEVLDVYENGLQLPDDVTLTWCDDNYGYITRLSNEAEKQRSGGAGVYYHVSYWGRPHDYLWLCTTPPALLTWQMRKAYDNGAQRIWILNAGDIKPAEYLIELFTDMAWNIESIDVSNVYKHTEKFYEREFGEVGQPLMYLLSNYYKYASIRKPEFLGWNRVEEYSENNPRGITPVADTEFKINDVETKIRLKIYDEISEYAHTYKQKIPKQRQSSYFQLIEYPVCAAAEMNKKMIYAQAARLYAKHYSADIYAEKSKQAYDSIVSLTYIYNNEISNGKWNGIMDFKPRNLPVFQPPVLPEKVENQDGDISTQEPGTNDVTSRLQEQNGYISIQPEHFVTKNGNSGNVINGLGYSGRAVEIRKGKENALQYKISTASRGEAILRMRFLPNHPLNSDDIRFAISIDDMEPQTVSIKTKFRSEEWKQNVLRNQAVRNIKCSIEYPGEHTITIYALDEGIVLDQMALDFNTEREFYVLPD